MYLSIFMRRCDDHALVDVEGDVDISSAPWLEHQRQVCSIEFVALSQRVERLAGLTGLTGPTARPPALGAAAR
jgi:hypothetical protein